MIQKWSYTTKREQEELERRQTEYVKQGMHPQDANYRAYLDLRPTLGLQEK